MKIGNDGFNPGGGDDLLQRMKRAHAREAETTEKIDAKASLESAENLDGISPAQDASGPKNPELEKRLLETASAALDGDFSTSDDIRGAVVDTIVDTRYGEGLARSERARIVDTLKQTLIDDPEFRAEVDNMLILASRELARN